MLKIPAPDQFGGKGDIPDNVKLIDWFNLMKNNGRIGCHQLGGLPTRRIPATFRSFYKYPGPSFERIGDNSAESSYYTWVDQHDMRPRQRRSDRDRQS
jgi:hypothetical protein